MDLLAAFRSALRRFDERVAAIHPTQWHSATPATDWDVRTLVVHLTVEHLWVPELLGGATLVEVGDRFDGDVLGDDPKAAWRSASAGSLAAWSEPDVLDRTVELSSGPAPAAEYCRQLTLDLTVHSWDLARAIGFAEEMPNDLTGFVVAYARDEVPKWQGLGLFAPPLDTAICADDLTELLAITGRAR
jgi:uncharacterized protein (TIGR03086 family)